MVIFLLSTRRIQWQKMRICILYTIFKIVIWKIYKNNKLQSRNRSELTKIALSSRAAIGLNDYLYSGLKNSQKLQFRELDINFLLNFLEKNSTKRWIFPYLLHHFPLFSSLWSPCYNNITLYFLYYLSQLYLSSL